MSALLRQTVASSSKCVARPTGVRLLSSTRARYDLMREVENNLNSKEVIEKKRREFEAKYGDKLKKRVET
jgi:ATP synthase F1 complex assembly factor 1